MSQVMELPQKWQERIAKRTAKQAEAKRKKAEREHKKVNRRVIDLTHRETGLGEWSWRSSRWPDGPITMRQRDVEEAFYGERAEADL